MVIQPCIKWSGSKRSQSDQIISKMPRSIDTYYEPFLGGGSILIKVLTSNIQVKNYLVSDLNSDLIGLWNCIKSNPLEVFKHYEYLWNEMYKLRNIDDKKQFFLNIRNRLNKHHDPLDFMFIMRTCFNGMPRYNGNGEFNNPLHINRDGILPNKLKDILMFWSSKIKCVEFINCSFNKIVPKESDFIYLDPPYANTKGMYFGNFDLENFYKYVDNLKCKFLLSFDGISKHDQTVNVPFRYVNHFYLVSGNSSFRRLSSTNKNVVVQESLYSNYNVEENKDNLELWCDLPINLA